MEIFFIILGILGALIGLAVLGVILRVVFWFMKILISLAFRGAVYIFIIAVIIMIFFV